MTFDTLGSPRLNSYTDEVCFPDVCLCGESTFSDFLWGLCMSEGAESAQQSRGLPAQDAASVSSAGLSSSRCQSNAAFPPTPAGLWHWPPCPPLSSIPASPKYLFSDFVSPPNSKIILCNCQMDISAGFFCLRILTSPLLYLSVSLPVFSVSNSGTSISQRPKGGGRLGSIPESFFFLTQYKIRKQ